MIEVIVFILALIGVLFAWVIISARRSLGYIFCNATISAWEAKMLSEGRLMELAEAPNVKSVFSALEDSEYRPQLAEVTKGEEFDILNVERALRESLNVRYRELLAMLPKERKETILRLLQRVDLWNLKAIITMIHNKVPVGERLKELLPSPTMPPERLQMLTSAEDLNSLLEFLRGSEYFDVVTSAMADYEKYGLKAILTALDKHFYASLWGDVQARRAQRQILRALVGYEIDSLNVKLILRLRQEGAAPDEIDRLLVKPSSELKDAMLREMIAAKDTRSAVHMIHITTHGKALSEAISEIEQRGVPAAEKVIDETRLRLSKWFELTHFFSIAPVISYINQKENEMRNLRAIIVLKANGVEPSRIKEKIIKVPKIEL